MINIEIWASGAGSNALNIIHYFKKSQKINVARVSSNKSSAGVLVAAEAQGINTHVISTEEFVNGLYLEDLKRRGVNYIILAGFLKLVPRSIVQHYKGRMLNIHPSLLPNYGGKNMYGDNVHKAVLAAGESKTGITIHEVNEEFDKGKIVAQFHCDIDPNENLDTLRSKIRKLEHDNFPQVIEEFILNRSNPQS
ncbi:phosphoribosylglycinamide formyltransferase [bacterium]|nr:phosphoribosylglycinamide formyltransferase [bacterium]